MIHHAPEDFHVRLCGIFKDILEGNAVITGWEIGGFAETNQVLPLRFVSACKVRKPCP